MMKTIGTVRKYGKVPYEAVVIHGGPGAPGYMAPVAREMSKKIGVIEPLQSQNTLSGQIHELKDQIEAHCEKPVTLIGSSWGAVLALFAAADHPKLVQKLILIGSAVFDADSSEVVSEIRLSRLSKEKRERLTTIKYEMSLASGDCLAQLSKEWGDIFFDCDVFDSLTDDLEVIEVQLNINQHVWSDFLELRDRVNCLKERFAKIQVPTLVIHGDYDPHIIEGIKPFLESCLPDVVFEILKDCGHYPWIERNAREKFFDSLNRFIDDAAR